jgi:hypothetical protein
MMLSEYELDRAGLDELEEGIEEVWRYVLKLMV